MFEKIKSWIAKTQLAFAQAFAASLIARTRYVKSNRGMGMIYEIIGICIGVYVFVYTIPSALGQFFNVSLWSGVPSSLQTLGQTVLGIVIIAVVLLLFLKSGHVGGD